MKFRPFILVLSAVTVMTVSADDGEAPSLAALRAALLLHASFDGRVDAEFAVGNPRLYHAPAGDRSQALPGLPEDGGVAFADGAGRHGGALQFTRKIRPTIFFHGARNLGYRTNGWNGAVSLWLRLDPDQDLEPGYCDPFQFVAQAWDEGNMFIEFSKDHTPRHFRYAILPVKRTWNPANRGWEDIPDAERPMVPVLRPPFKRDRWTHVAFCFGNINSGQKDGWGRLFLDGRDQGAFEDWSLVFNWDVEKSALTLGLSYIGWIDDVAVFNRPLTGAEVRAIYELRNGVKSLPAAR